MSPECGAFSCRVARIKNNQRRAAEVLEVRDRQVQHTQCAHLQCKFACLEQFRRGGRLMCRSENHVHAVSVIFCISFFGRYARRAPDLPPTSDAKLMETLEGPLTIASRVISEVVKDGRSVRGGGSGGVKCQVACLVCTPSALGGYICMSGAGSAGRRARVPSSEAYECNILSFIFGSIPLTVL